MSWNWPGPNPKTTTLEDIIKLLNVRLGSLGKALAPLFSAVESVNTFANGATTPSIFGSNVWKATNTVGTVITNFLDGTPGKRFQVWSTTANTTITNNANIVTKSGANIVMTATDIRDFLTVDGALWREI